MKKVTIELTLEEAVILISGAEVGVKLASSLAETPDQIIVANRLLSVINEADLQVENQSSDQDLLEVRELFNRDYPDR